MFRTTVLAFAFLLLARPSPSAGKPFTMTSNEVRVTTLIHNLFADNHPNIRDKVDGIAGWNSVRKVMLQDLNKVNALKNKLGINYINYFNNNNGGILENGLSLFNIEGGGDDVFTQYINYKKEYSEYTGVMHYISQHATSHVEGESILSVHKFTAAGIEPYAVGIVQSIIECCEYGEISNTHPSNAHPRVMRCSNYRMKCRTNGETCYSSTPRHPSASVLLEPSHYFHLDGMDFNEGVEIYAVAVDSDGVRDDGDRMRSCHSMHGALVVSGRDGTIVDSYLHDIFDCDRHIPRHVYFHLIQSSCSIIHVGDWGDRVSGGIMGRLINEFEGMPNWIDIIFASSEFNVLMSSTSHHSNPIAGDDNDTNQHGINLPRLYIPRDRHVYQDGSHGLIPSYHGIDDSPIAIAPLPSDPQRVFIMKKWREDVVIIIIEKNFITLLIRECHHEGYGYYALLSPQVCSDTMSTINPDPSWGASTRCLIEVLDTIHRACIRWHNTLWGAYFADTSTAGHFLISSDIHHAPSSDVGHNTFSSLVITEQFLHGMGCAAIHNMGTSRDDYSTVLIDVVGTTTFIVSHFLTSCMTRVYHNIERIDLFGGSLRSRAKHHRDTSNVSWGDIVRKERHHHDRRVIPDIVWGCSNRIRGDTRSAMNYFAVYYQDCSSLVVQTGTANTSMIDFVYGESRLLRIEWIMYGILSCLMLIMHASPWNNGKSSVLYTQQHRCCMNTINYFTLLEGILEGSWLSSMAYSWEGRSKCMTVNRWGESTDDVLIYVNRWGENIDDVLIYGHELYAANAIKCLSVWNDSLVNDTGIIPWHTTTCQCDGEIDVHGSIGSIAYKLRRLCKTRYQCNYDIMYADNGSSSSILGSCIARLTSTETDYADASNWDDSMTLITMSQIVSRDYSYLEFYRDMEECGDGDANDIVVFREATYNETKYRRTSNYTIADASPDYALSYDKLGGTNGEPNSRISPYRASYRSSSESDLVGIENVSSYRFVRVLYTLITNATNVAPNYGERSKIGTIGNSSFHVPRYTCAGQLNGGINGRIDVNSKIALEAVYSFAMDYYHDWICNGILEEWCNQWTNLTMRRDKCVKRRNTAKPLVTSTMVCTHVHQVDGNYSGTHIHRTFLSWGATLPNLHAMLSICVPIHDRLSCGIIVVDDGKFYTTGIAYWGDGDMSSLDAYDHDIAWGAVEKSSPSITSAASTAMFCVSPTCTTALLRGLLRISTRLPSLEVFIIDSFDSDITNQESCIHCLYMATTLETGEHVSVRCFKKASCTPLVNGERFMCRLDKAIHAYSDQDNDASSGNYSLFNVYWNHKQLMNRPHICADDMASTYMQQLMGSAFCFPRCKSVIMSIILVKLRVLHLILDTVELEPRISATRGDMIYGIGYCYGDVQHDRWKCLCASLGLLVGLLLLLRRAMGSHTLQIVGSKAGHDTFVNLCHGKSSRRCVNGVHSFFSKTPVDCVAMERAALGKRWIRWTIRPNIAIHNVLEEGYCKVNIQKDPIQSTNTTNRRGVTEWVRVQVDTDSMSTINTGTFRGIGTRSSSITSRMTMRISQSEF